MDYFAIFSIDERRVKLDNTNKTKCKLVIQHVEPKDAGTWSFYIIVGQEPRAIRHTHFAAVHVKGEHHNW